MEISCFNFHMSPFQCLTFDNSHNGCATQLSVQWPCLSPSLVPERPLTLQNLCLEAFKKHGPLQYGVIINIQPMLLYLLLIFWFLSEPKPNHFHIFPSFSFSASSDSFPIIQNATISIALRSKACILLLFYNFSHTPIWNLPGSQMHLLISVQDYDLPQQSYYPSGGNQCVSVHFFANIVSINFFAYIQVLFYVYHSFAII